MCQMGEALLLPTDWLSFLCARSCSHRNTLFSDIKELKQTLLSETLCPDPPPEPKSYRRRFGHAWGGLPYAVRSSLRLSQAPVCSWSF